jgi:hypothetical protein
MFKKTVDAVHTYAIRLPCECGTFPANTRRRGSIKHGYTCTRDAIQQNAGQAAGEHNHTNGQTRYNGRPAGESIA